MGINCVETLNDTFVPRDAVERWAAQMRAAGARWELHAYGGARHGFSNPAQALNANPAFGYDPAIAAASWATMKAVLADAFAE